MRKLILLTFVLLFDIYSCQKALGAMRSVWATKANIEASQAETENLKGYKNKAYCEHRTKAICYEVDGEKMKTHVFSGILFIENSVKKADYDQSVADKVAEKTAREVKLAARKDALKNCASVLRDSPTNEEIKTCVRLVLVHVISRQLTADEM